MGSSAMETSRKINRHNASVVHGRGTGIIFQRNFAPAASGAKKSSRKGAKPQRNCRKYI
jgi:hypothetical protein